MTDVEIGSFERSRMRKLLFVSAVLLAAAAPAVAGPLSVDGNLADWGITVADGNGSNINAYLGQAGIGQLGFHKEDSDDLAGDGGFLGPNHGGQNYDAEFMSAARDGNTLFVAIVTGQRPDNGLQRFAPGDLRIVTTTGVYGLEIGGGTGGVAPGNGIVDGAAGSTYLLNGSGFTTGLLATDPLQTAGSIWANPTWINDPIAPVGPTQFQMAGGILVNTADYVYTRNDFTSQHAVIELSFDLAWFGGEVTSLHWRPSCGNDELDLAFSPLIITQVVPLPEGASLGLAGLFLVGAMGWRSRRRRLAER